MRKLGLGLDVGISSVGWGIIDLENNSVVNCGVRMFPEGDSKANEGRRNSRSSRRLIRRREHRIDRLYNLLLKNKIINSDFINLDNPYKTRVKGLTEKLTNEELATALLHIAKRRGVSGSWVISDDEEKQKDDEKTKSTLNKNNSELKNKYICELQLERLNEFGKVRGQENTFKTDDYIKEVKKILSNQRLNEKLEKDILDIISSKREYFEGPGSEKSPTPYGRFFLENGQLIKIDLIEKMRGKCSIYPDELRAPKMSYSADMFNFLNDLNNISFDGELITKDIKNIIINDYINKKGNITILQLQKLLNVKSKYDIKGLRINKKGEPIITEFKGYKKILKLVNDNNLNQDILDKDIVDKIIEILTSKKGVAERKEELKKQINFLTKEEIELLSIQSGFTGYHSLSMKIIKELLPELMENNYNQMQLFQKNNYFSNRKSYLGYNNIPFNNELILSATARRAQKEAIKVINAIRKEYGELDSVIIEMAREKNSDDKKKTERDNQKHGEEINKNVNEILKDRKVSGLTRQKIRLYLEQNGKCLYTGKSIDLNQLIDDKYFYEIDHIIPISISLDDSFNNKVLVLRSANQEKGQRTPFQYFKNKANNDWNYDDFKNEIISNHNINWKKKANLLLEKDINKFEVRKEFVNRNLVDTRYATKGLLNTLQDYYKDNKIYTKVYTINGKITNMFRKKVQLEKHRDLDNSHHAIDALIVASIKKANLLNSLLKLSVSNETEDQKINDLEVYDEKTMKFISNLDNVDVKFSNCIDRKPNKQLSDLTIYGTRYYDEKEYVIGKYKNIYDKTGETVAELFRNNKAKEKLLVYRNDKDSFDLLEKIVNEYKGEKNPFLKYYEEKKDYIRKKSKKGNGPVIKDLKYIDGQIGDTVIDLTKKFSNPSNKRRVILKQLNPYRTDIYLDENGFYKILNITQYDLSKKEENCYISESKYEQLKDKYNIDSNCEFVFSLYKNNVINVDGKFILYAGIMNINSGIICYKTIDGSKVFNGGKEIKQPYINIKKSKVFEKYNADVLGNLYKIKEETCKLDLDML